MRLAASAGGVGHLPMLPTSQLGPRIGGAAMRRLDRSEESKRGGRDVERARTAAEKRGASESTEKQSGARVWSWGHAANNGRAFFQPHAFEKRLLQDDISLA